MKTITILILFFVFIISAYGQITALTENGKVVLLKADGSWKYLERTKQKKANCSYQTFEATKIILSKSKIGESGAFALNGNLGLEDKELLFYCTYEGDLGKVDQNSYAIVKFEDNSTIELKGLNRIDKGNPPTFKAYIFDPYIFMTKKAVKIKLVLRDNFTDVLLSDKDFFKKSIQCIY